jgi:phage-related protein
MKAVIWLGSSRDELGGFPADARRESGYQLHRVQLGEDPSDWKPMSSVGAGVREIRIRDDSGTFRILYLATRVEAVYVLHCFQKKTAKMSKGDLELARRRFKTIPDAWSQQ